MTLRWLASIDKEYLFEQIFKIWRLRWKFCFERIEGHGVKKIVQPIAQHQDRQPGLSGETDGAAITEPSTRIGRKRQAAVAKVWLWILAMPLIRNRQLILRLTHLADLASQTKWQVAMPFSQVRSRHI